MITESDRKSTGSADGLIAHYFNKSNEGLSPGDPDYHPDHNDRVRVLAGDSDDLKIWDQYGKANGKMYGVREVVLAPHAHLTDDQIHRMSEIAREILDPAGDHDFVLVEHSKDRAGGSDAPHYHLLLNEMSFETGKILSSQERNQRAQLISRLVEYEFGLDPVPGYYDRWCAARLREMGRDKVANDIAYNLRHAREGKELKKFKTKIEDTTFNIAEHQRAKRLGVDLADVRHQLRATKGDPQAVAQVLIKFQAAGFNLIKGRKDQVVLIEQNGWQKSIQRVAGFSNKTDFYSAFMAAKKPTGLQKLKRGAVAGKFAGRIDSVLANMPNSSSGPVAMYVNDDDPDAPVGTVYGVESG